MALLPCNCLLLTGLRNMQLTQITLNKTGNVRYDATLRPGAPEPPCTPYHNRCRVQFKGGRQSSKTSEQYAFEKMQYKTMQQILNAKCRQQNILRIPKGMAVLLLVTPR